MIRSLHDSRQWWTYIFILIAILIVIATVYYSNSLSQKLAKEERIKTELWAETMKTLVAPGPLDASDEDPISYKELERRYEETQNSLMSLILKIIESNQSIPVLLCDENGVINPDYSPVKDSDTSKLNEFKAKNPPIVIELENGNHYVYYDDSTLLKRLMMFPYVQLSVVFVFIILSFLALISTKKAEQNKV